MHYTETRHTNEVVPQQKFPLDLLLQTLGTFCCRALGSRMLLGAHIHTLNTSCRPPTRPVPMTELCILRHGIEGDEFQPAKTAVADTPILRGGAHILPLVGTRTGSVLYDVASASGIQHSVIGVNVFLPPTRPLVRWIVANGPVLLFAVVAATTIAPEHNAVLGREVVSALECCVEDERMSSQFHWNRRKKCKQPPTAFTWQPVPFRRTDD